jgi:hypothetical protein
MAAEVPRDAEWMVSDAAGAIQKALNVPFYGGRPSLMAPVPSRGPPSRAFLRLPAASKISLSAIIRRRECSSLLSVRLE